MSCKFWSELNFFFLKVVLKGEPWALKHPIISGGPADFTLKIASENNGIRQGAFETMHSFCILIEKNVAETTEIICSALGEGTMMQKTCEKWFQRFHNGDFDLSERERRGQPKKNSKTRNWSNSWRKILLKRKKTCTRSRSYWASNFPLLLICLFYIKLLN